jgi:plastocyanin
MAGPLSDIVGPVVPVKRVFGIFCEKPVRKMQALKILRNIIRLSLLVAAVVSVQSPTALAHHKRQDGTVVSGQEAVVPVREIPVKYTEIDVRSGGSISGAVKVLSDRAVADTKGAIVYIKDIGWGKPFVRSSDGGTPFIIDQKDYVFVPHVTVVPVGCTVELRNADPEMHNLHSFSTKNASFNEGIPVAGEPIKKKLDFVETVRIGCDIHKEMAAWIVVRDNPYYCVTGEDGSFKIPDIPPGTYKLVIWHEDFDREELIALRTDVSVESGGEFEVDFYLSHRK